MSSWTFLIKKSLFICILTVCFAYIVVNNTGTRIGDIVEIKKSHTIFSYSLKSNDRISFRFKGPSYRKRKDKEVYPIKIIITNKNTLESIETTFTHKHGRNRYGTSLFSTRYAITINKDANYLVEIILLEGINEDTSPIYFELKKNMLFF